MDTEKNNQSDPQEPIADNHINETVRETIPLQKPKNRFFVSRLFVVLVLLAVVLFFIFRFVSTKNTDTPSPAFSGVSGSTGANASTKEADTISPELRLNRPRSVSKPQAPPFKSIDLKNP